ncbi:SAM-dependent methyltransferase [Amycolatopsis suaedae]|uniref:Class I SAM-dependent methyltransferase n=1 Tax=Amycolatopsis suaedae TaxID=2510978 RepID=A0A4Q7J645_9PSEU|nr:class I SAM-dependent methyltransferase [Amycolatopsis suaedae]RZQ62276.1 class I SAM-dependent methyltransferase [Amycolatopsis suaedae]
MRRLPTTVTRPDRTRWDDPHEIVDVLGVLTGTVCSVLDLGCGSGRLTLPLAQRGYTVTGLDSSAAMLLLLAARLAEVDGETAARVRSVLADMVSFTLGERFGAVVLGAGSACLLGRAERSALYGRIHDHLTPDGVFLVPVAGGQGAAGVPGEPSPPCSEQVRGELVRHGFEVLSVLPPRQGQGGQGVAGLLTCRVKAHRRSQASCL